MIDLFFNLIITSTNDVATIAYDTNDQSNHGNNYEYNNNSINYDNPFTCS